MSYVIRRGPTREIVSGLYDDRTVAQEKADDLNDRRAFDYTVTQWGS